MKQNLKNLHEYSIAISEYWSNEYYITLRVLLQNMAFQGKIIDKAINIIELMANINKEDHVISSILSDLKNIQMANDMDKLSENELA